MTIKSGKLVEFTLIGDPGEAAQKCVVRSNAVLMAAPGKAEIRQKVGKQEAVVPINGVTQTDVEVVYLTLFNGMHVVVTESYDEVQRVLREADAAEVTCVACGVTMLVTP